MVLGKKFIGRKNGLENANMESEQRPENDICPTNITPDRQHSMATAGWHRMVATLDFQSSALWKLFVRSNIFFLADEYGRVHTAFIPTPTPPWPQK
jgi:hypothetical protein